MSGYDDLANTHVPATGTVAPAAWGLQIRENQEFMIDPPACSVYASTAQTLAHNTTAALTADSENYDNDSMHSTVTNTSRVTIQTAGRYLFTATVDFQADPDGVRALRFLLNGVTFYAGFAGEIGNASNTMQITAVRTIVCVPGDYVEAHAQHLANNNLNVTLAEFAAVYLTR